MVAEGKRNVRRYDGRPDWSAGTSDKLSGPPTRLGPLKHQLPGAPYSPWALRRAGRKRPGSFMDISEEGRQITWLWRKPFDYAPRSVVLSIVSGQSVSWIDMLCLHVKIKIANYFFFFFFLRLTLDMR